MVPHKKASLGSSRRVLRLPALLLLAAGLGAGSPSASADTLDRGAAARFARLALECVHREYPNHLSHTLASDADVRPPRELTPAFYGCFDWHSSVHGHWLLVRLARSYPDAPFAAAARTAVDESLTSARIAGEVAYLRAAGRASFERPYGLAWLLMLDAELRIWDDPDARRWAVTLEPLAQEAVLRIERWLPDLSYPIRIGEHNQTAFAFGLMLDYAAVSGNARLRELLIAKTRQFYAADTACPLAYEPSGEDFLSPCLAEADLMRRVQSPGEYARWLRTFLPQIPSTVRTVWLVPAKVTDRADPKLAHLDGLNLSRAWMLEGIAAALPPADARVAVLRAAARAHGQAALPAVTGEHYEGGHWLGTFATYLVTGGGAAHWAAARNLRGL